MSAHRYWRLVITDNALSGSGTHVVSMAEIELRASEGGSDETGSGTASASTIYGGSYTADKAVDNSTSTYWASSNTFRFPSWWSYDFGSGNDKAIVQLAITNRDDTYWEEAPDRFIVQSSDNGSTWNDEALIEKGDLNWTAAGQTKVVTLSSYPVPTVVDPGDYRYYRVYIHACKDGTYTGFTEIEMREALAGSDVTGSGTASASSTYAGTAAAYAVDNDTSTSSRWTSDSYCPAWWQYDFGSGVTKNIKEITLTTRSDGYYYEAPTEFYLEGSSNGSDWDIVYWGIIFGSDPWTSGQTRTFSFEAGTTFSVSLAEQILATNVSNVYIEDSTPAGVSNTTIQFMTGWELAESWLEWDSFNFGTSDAVSSGAYRSGNYALCLTNSGSYLRKNVSAGADFYVQAAINWSGATPVAGKYIRWMNGTTALGTLNVDASQHIALYTGDGATLRATGTKTLQQDRWYVIEVHFTIADSNGVLAARVDGVDDCSWTGDTKPGSETTVDVIELNCPTTNDVYFDDFIIATGNWPDRLRVEYLPLKWDVLQNWSSIGFMNDSLHFRRLQDYTQLQRTSFCYTQTAGQTEAFDLSNAPIAADTIVAIQAFGIFQVPSTTAGLTIKMSLASGVNELSSDGIYIPPGPVFNSELLEAQDYFRSWFWHDLDGATITKTLVDGLTVGYKLV